MSDSVSASGSVRLRPRRSASEIYFFGRELFPASPFSWLAPLWYFGCGLLASGYWRAPDAAILPPLLGLVLVVPLLGTAWRGALGVSQRRLRIQTASVADAHSGRFSLPYALPSSPGQRFSAALTRAVGRWQAVRRLLELPLLELGIGCAAAVIVAAVLGVTTLWVTLAGLAVAIVTAFASRRIADNALATVGVPLLLCWMVALSLSGEPGALSTVVGVSLATGASATFVVERTGRGLLLQLTPQVLLAVCVLITGQPLAGLLVGLCAFAQVLWAPALASTERRAQYFQSLQLLWVVVMVASALAIGAAR